MSIPKFGKHCQRVRAQSLRSFANVAGGNLESVFQRVMDLPAMSQFQEIANGYKYSKAEDTGGKVAEAALRYGASQATSFVPNVVSGVAQGVDGTVRDTYNGDTVWENSLNAIKARGFSDALIANQRRYNLEHTNNIINSSGRRVRGFVGIEALVQPDLTPNGWRA